MLASSLSFWNQLVCLSIEQVVIMDPPNEENNSKNDKNATTQKPKSQKTQIDLLEFIPELGDLSPISEFKGPRVPSRRQVLRHVLFFVALGLSLVEAGGKVVDNVLKKHVAAAQAKTRNKIIDDVVSLYKKTRS